MATVFGELKQWHAITIDFQGPAVQETASTFRDYRLNVTFTNQDTGEVKIIPGYFAADGDAENTSATSGDVWRVKFTPPSTGNWTYEASFRTGDDVAVSLDPTAGTATSFDGETGSLAVAVSDKTGTDLRAHGTLQADGDFYLNYAGSGDTYIKSGVGGPESFLAYDGFDNTLTKIVQGQDVVKDYDPHLQDFNAGDPTWGNGEGQGIIGAINYMAETGINGIYLVTNSIGGDSQNVHPWSSEEEIIAIPHRPDEATIDALDPALFQSFDVSKLAQWEIVFDHMQDKGIAVQLFFQENENQTLLNDGGLGLERMLYIREMLARFGHLNGLIYSFGEEIELPHETTVEVAGYFNALDAYDHPLSMHTKQGRFATEQYEPELDEDAWDVYAIQQSSNTLVRFIEDWRQRSIDNGTPTPMYWDEAWNNSLGLQPDTDPVQQAGQREVFWGAMLNGAAGVSWYPGFLDDIIQEDFRTREVAYTWTVAARKLFEQLPLNDMNPEHSATPSTTDYVFAQLGEIYVIYLPEGGGSSLNLSGYTGTYDVVWFNPRADEMGQDGTVTSVQAGGVVNLGQPPSDTTEDWAVIVRKSGEYRLEGIDAPVANQDPIARNDTANTAFETGVSINVLGNDNDPDGETVTLQSVNDPTNGSAEIMGGQIVYTPNTGFSGGDTFSYSITDPQGATSTAFVTVNVEDEPIMPVTPPPATAAAAFASTSFDQPDAVNANQTGEAIVRILSGVENIQISNFGNNSFEIENVGDKRIVGAYFDVEGALYGDVVFDPDGTGGDSVAKGLTINTNGGTSVIAPSAYNELFQATDNASDPLFADGVAQNDAQGGFRGLLLKFAAQGTGGFSNGESVGFSIDMDPNSIAGWNKGILDTNSVPLWDVGGVSGAELIGSTVTILFSDGTTATSQLMSDGSQAGSQALVSQDSPDLAASVVVNGAQPGETGTYDGDATVIVSGPAGSTIRVVLTKGIQPAQNTAQGVGANVDARLADEDFVANNAIEFQVVDITLGAGETSRNISNLFDYDNNPNGYNFAGNDQLPLGFVASVIDPTNEDLPLGPVSAPIYLSYQAGNVNQPPIARNDTATTDEEQSFLINVLANDDDPEGGALTLQSVNNPPNGTAIISGNQILYTPDDGFTGQDVFGYTVADAAGNTDTATIAVTVEAEDPTPTDSAFELFLVDATTDQLVGQIVNGVIDPDLLSTAQYSIEARYTDGSAGSLTLALSTGHSKTEGVAPYALFGDSSGDFFGAALPSQDFNITLTAHSAGGGGGAVLAQETIALSIEDGGPTDPVDPEGSTYIEVADGLTRAQSLAEAAALGGTLLRIDSQAENDYIFETFYDGNAIRLDASDEAIEGVWLNSDGNPVAYTNWLSPNEPNNIGNIQHWAYMAGPNGEWGDHSRNNSGTFDGNSWSPSTVKTIIEIPGGDPVDPVDPGDEFVFNGSRYERVADGLTRAASLQQADALGGTLLRIDDAAENEFIFNTFYDDNAIRLDASDAANEGVWVNSDGSALDYENWLSPFEPNNINSNQHWAYMAGPDGGWGDHSINNSGTYDGNSWSPSTVVTIIEIDIA